MALRDTWIEKRESVAGANGNRNMSQMHLARQGLVTEEMVYRRQARKDRTGIGPQRSPLERGSSPPTFITAICSRWASA